MGEETASTTPPIVADQPSTFRTFYAFAVASFRRYSTYRQATVAAAFTNTTFGILRCSVLLAVAAAGGGAVAGYHNGQLATYVFVGQGLIGVVLLWGDSSMATRITSGDVVIDLLRPVDPVYAGLAGDLGRAGYAALTRFVIPLAAGAFLFHLYTPTLMITYPLFVVSTLLAVVISFGCRYVVNASAYWLLDARGPVNAFTLAASALGGLYFPLHFLPRQVTAALWLLTPFPSLLQAPLDVVVERDPLPVQVGMVAVQAGWALVMLAVARAVQRRGERRLVVQGG